MGGVRSCFAEVTVEVYGNIKIDAFHNLHLLLCVQWAPAFTLFFHTVIYPTAVMNCLWMCNETRFIFSDPLSPDVPDSADLHTVGHCDFHTSEALWWDKGKVCVRVALFAHFQRENSSVYYLNRIQLMVKSSCCWCYMLMFWFAGHN